MSLKKSLGKIAFAGLLGIGLLGGFGNCEIVKHYDGDTINQVVAPSRTLQDKEKYAILKTADRLIQLQNTQQNIQNPSDVYTNGSWDWVITNATGPTIYNYSNIAGVNAEVLLDAYTIDNNNSKYLAAAQLTGDYLVNLYSDPKNPPTIFTYGNYNINSSNVKFLYDLGNKIGGVNKYTTEANKLMNQVITTYPTGASLLAAEESGRAGGMGVGYGEGIVPWDLYEYIGTAKSANNPSWANDLANTLKNNSPMGVNDKKDLTYILGLDALVMAGDTDAIQPLLNAQNQDGSWSDGDGQIQDIAYSIMALNKINPTAAGKAAQYLVNNFGYGSGIKGWYDNMGLPVPNYNEVSEVDSEAGDSLYINLTQ
jgi:hypothetical protein